MASRPRLALTDILHRGVVYSLVGLSVWGIYMMGAVHRDKMRRGEGACANSELLGLVWLMQIFGFLSRGMILCYVSYVFVGGLALCVFL